MKVKTVFVCQSCGVISPKWSGKCSSCQAWNTLVEERQVVQSSSSVEKTSGRGLIKSSGSKAPIVLQDVGVERINRHITTDDELNRVLGGGIVPGSVVLFGGEPGIGKSTLLLQVALQMEGQKVLYVSGEESAEQIKMRAERILPGKGAHCYLLTETRTETIIQQADALQPNLLIIDSIQTLEMGAMESAPGSVSQVRESAAALVRWAKENHTAVFMIGHITKEGSLAGPKVLEHMVDTVLQFEGDRHMAYRLLRTTKNRFGSTSELGIYEMEGEGLRKVANPSEMLITQRDTDLSGFTIGVMLEGNRPLLLEVQALVSTATYGTPQRSTNGMDGRRLQMLLAVLEKRAGFRLGQQDVFLNMAGGLRVEDPAIDLAVCAALISSYTDVPISPNTAFAAEIGLGGELRAVNKIEARVAEAAKLGYKEIFISGHQKVAIRGKYSIKIHYATRLAEIFPLLFAE